MTVKEIREDLREIRYYYGMSDLFKAGSKLIPPQAIVEKVERYNKAISTAHAKLYRFYESYDDNGNTIWQCECHVEGYGAWTGKHSSKKYGKKSVAYSMLCEILEVEE